ALTEEDLLKLDNFGPKKAQNLLAGIEAARHRPLRRLLYALVIRHVGQTTAEIIVAHFDSLDALSKASIEDLESIEGIGRVIAESIVDWFRIEDNQELIRALEANGVNTRRLPDEAPAADAETPATGKTFVLTGTLPTLSRTEAESLIKRARGRRNTHFVVAGQSPGSKLDRAQELGVPVLDEQGLRELLQME